ncbi:unnamed protein product [Trichogramma brassicae]|uniref:Uncharacterized protein n=1 Tax=Trichogramma brassicae TaxID=86971 RepID=A0A6H5I2E2_9HYME|nr:unnamed protein product [Trichogramma brassicae]
MAQSGPNTIASGQTSGKCSRRQWQHTDAVAAAARQYEISNLYYTLGELLTYRISPREIYEIIGPHHARVNTEPDNNDERSYARLGLTLHTLRINKQEKRSYHPPPERTIDHSRMIMIIQETIFYSIILLPRSSKSMIYEGQPNSTYSEIKINGSSPIKLGKKYMLSVYDEYKSVFTYMWRNI